MKTYTQTEGTFLIQTIFLPLICRPTPNGPSVLHPVQMLHVPKQTWKGPSLHRTPRTDIVMFLCPRFLFTLWVHEYTCVALFLAPQRAANRRLLSTGLILDGNYCDGFEAIKPNLIDAAHNLCSPQLFNPVVWPHVAIKSQPHLNANITGHLLKETD